MTDLPDNIIPLPGRMPNPTELERLAQQCDVRASTLADHGFEEEAVGLHQCAAELRQKAWVQRQAARRAMLARAGR